MRLIDADEITLNYGGLVYIAPSDYRGTAEYFFNQIQSMPTVEAWPVVHAHYFPVYHGTGDVCSNCGTIDIPQPDYKYCPYCGA